MNHVVSRFTPRHSFCAFAVIGVTAVVLAVAVVVPDTSAWMRLTKALLT